MDAHAFLKSLAIVLCVAAVTTVVFQRLRQPVVLGYILAGLIVGPHVPIPLVADVDIVATLSEVGVVLLMFSLGLEFSLSKLVRVGPTAGLTAIIQSSIMVWLGFVIGQGFGWTALESLFAGAIIAISSTTIIAKAFDEQGIKGRLRDLVVGILIVEDLIAVVLMAVLTTIASGRALSPVSLAGSAGRLVAFLVGLVVVGLVLVPRTIRAVARLQRAETLLVASIGICFAVALLALEFGYSVALGAFMAGSLVAESGEEKRVEQLVHPVRDVFAAIFFVSVGMLIDPALIARHWIAVAVFVIAVIVGKIVGVTLGAFLTGNGTRSSVQAGMSLAQIGEFSFIIAALGLSTGATREFLYPVAVAVSALTTLTTPWLIRVSEPAALFLDRKLPRRVQTFTSLYGSWVEKLRTAPREETRRVAVRRLVRLLFLDAVLLMAINVWTSIERDALLALIVEHLGTTPLAARILLTAATVVVAAPFVIGIVRVSRRLGTVLAEAALPAAAKGSVDLALAPRRAMVVTFQLAVVLLVGLPLLALTQPLVGGVEAAIGFVLLLGILSVVFWRSAANLQSHVRASAQILVEALAAQAKPSAPKLNDRTFAPIEHLFAGLGEPTPLQVRPESRAVGKTLAELDLRGRTGASVLAIFRDGRGVTVPSAAETIESRDVLAIAGTHEALEAARRLLNDRGDSRP